MLAGDGLPECGTYLVALYMKSIPHRPMFLYTKVNHSRIGRFEGEPAQREMVSLFDPAIGTRGTRIRGEVVSLTISRMPGILAVL